MNFRRFIELNTIVAHREIIKMTSEKPTDK